MKKKLLLVLTFLILIPSSAVLASDNSNYNPILRKYVQAINEKWDPGQLTENNMYYDMGFNYDNSTTLDYYGYAFLDLNGDGSDELLIGIASPRDDYDTTYIMDAYYLSGTTPVRLLEAWDRNTFRLTQNNELMNYGSGGATVNGYALWRFNGNGLGLVYSVLRDGNSFYYSETTKFPENESSGRRISESEFNQYAAVNYKGLNWTPFSQYSESSAPSQPSNPVPDQPSNPTNGTNVYRVYLPTTGEHMFTTDFYEVQVLSGRGWSYEGVAWVAPNSGSPIYRLYSPVTTAHLYTSDLNEVNTLQGQGWSVDNGFTPLFYSGGNNCVYRLYSSGLRQHMLTTNIDEYNQLGGNGWNQEGVALYCQ